MADEFPPHHTPCCRSSRPRCRRSWSPCGCSPAPVRDARSADGAAAGCVGGHDGRWCWAAAGGEGRTIGATAADPVAPPSAPLVLAGWELDGPGSPCRRPYARAGADVRPKLRFCVHATAAPVLERSDGASCAAAARPLRLPQSSQSRSQESRSGAAEASALGDTSSECNPEKLAPRSHDRIGRCRGRNGPGRTRPRPLELSGACDAGRESRR